MKRLKKKRDNHKVSETLRELERLAGSEENLVPILIEAVESYATVGEICDVLRKVFGEYADTQF